MNSIVKRDIIRILSTVLELIKATDKSEISKLKELSNHTIHNASIFQDKDSVSIAVVVYALSKVIERKAVGDKIPLLIRNARDFLAEDSEKLFRECIKEILDRISYIDSGLGLYIGKVIEDAQIKKGGKLFEHGISVGKASELLGISQWELMSYIGKTGIIDSTPERTDTKRRLAFARQLFGL
ncbi:MAG: hypothetical protein ABH879_05945 [archaeon]